MPWSPLLRGELARRARAILDDITAGLRTAAALDSSEHPIDLASGDAGLATYFAFSGDAETAERLLARAGDNLDASPNPSLYVGFTGVAWALVHLPGRVLPANEDDPCEAIDDAIADVLDHSEVSLYELLFGLVGMGVYLLERLPRPGAARSLERIVELLEAAGRREPSGVGWFLDTEGGHYNLGVAHGVPGVIAFLGRCIGAGVGGDRAERLLDDACRWLLARRLAGQSSLFHAQVWEGREPIPARLAWCYGEPGIATALLLAARRARRPQLAADAIAIAQFGARRDPADAHVMDASICHGAAGNGHLFNRLYQATNDAELERAAVYWLTRALDMHRPGTGVGGYRYWKPAAAGGWLPDPSFLNGAAGIGLAITAAISDIEPTWDRVLLADVPPSDT